MIFMRQRPLLADAYFVQIHSLGLVDWHVLGQVDIELRGKFSGIVGIKRIPKQRDEEQHEQDYQNAREIDLPGARRKAVARMLCFRQLAVRRLLRILLFITVDCVLLVEFVDNVNSRNVIFAAKSFNLGKTLLFWGKIAEIAVLQIDNEGTGYENLFANV